MFYALVSNLIFLTKAVSRCGDRCECRNGCHMLWSSALHQYVCPQSQVFLHDLRMYQRLKFSQQGQNCDTANPTNLLHCPRVSQDTF